MEEMTVSWKAYVDTRFNDSIKSTEVAFASAQKATDAALAAADKYASAAQVNTEKWQEAANEWRNAMNDRERQFLTRKEFYSMMGTAVAIISLLIALNRLL